MIVLEVEDYCHDCPDFEADVQKADIWAGIDEEIWNFGDTVIRCEYRERCRSIRRYLKKDMEKEGD